MARERSMVPVWAMRLAVQGGEVRAGSGVGRYMRGSREGKRTCKACRRKVWHGWPFHREMAHHDRGE